MIKNTHNAGNNYLIIMKHFVNREDILEYITKYPQFIAGFASGEGSFSAYAYVDLANTWGIQFFQLEYPKRWLAKSHTVCLYTKKTYLLVIHNNGYTYRYLWSELGLKHLSSRRTWNHDIYICFVFFFGVRNLGVYAPSSFKNNKI